MKRYLYGISKRRNWLLLVLLIPCLYLLYMSFQTDRFTVWQSLSIPEDAHVALVSTPVGYQTFSDVYDNQEGFFRNSYMVTMLLQETFSGATTAWPGDQVAALIESVRNDMSMVIPGNGRPQIQYDGKDRETGEMLVTYYSSRLLRLINEGYKRSGEDLPATLSVSGAIETIGHRALWRQDRLIPLIAIVILSIAGVLTLLWGLEWSDPSFKSERQIGRYLDLPVLGSIPNLNRVSDKIKHRPESIGSEQPHPV